MLDIETAAVANAYTRRERPTMAWVGQAASGVLLLVLLVVHMIAHHFVVEGGLRTHAQVVDYLRSPVIFVIEHLFLATVTAHALLGIRAVLFDFGLSPATERRVTIWLAGVGVLTVAYGVWLLWTVAIVNRSRALCCNGTETTGNACRRQPTEPAVDVAGC